MSTEFPYIEESLYHAHAANGRTDIKTAYKQRCLELHPDKQGEKPDVEKKKAEELFKLVI